MKLRRGERGKARAAGPADGAPRWSPSTVALVGHRSAGKTSLGELLLQAARVTRTVGSVDIATSLLDHSAEARRLRMTTSLSMAWVDHAGRSLVLVDTPGTDALADEQARGLHVCDLAVVVVDAASGVEVGTERVIAATAEDGRPAFVVVTKLERLDRLSEVVEAVQGCVQASRPDTRVLPLQLPLFDEDGGLQGLIDVLGDQVLRYDGAGTGAVSPEPIPQRRLADARAAREVIAEAVALTDDALLEEYLEELELPPADLARGLIRGIATGRLIPLFLTSAARHVGAAPLLDALASFTPRPRCPTVGDPDGAVRALTEDEQGTLSIAEVVACQQDAEGHPVTWLKLWAGQVERQGWRVEGRRLPVRVGKQYRIRGPRRATAPPSGPGALLAVYEDLGLAVGTTLTREPGWRVHRPAVARAAVAWWVRCPSVAPEVFEEALHHLVRTDGALDIEVDEASGAQLLWGRSEGHLRIAVRRLADRVGMPVTTALPPVAYVEALTSPVAPVEAVHEIRGEHGLVSEFGQCELVLVPDEPRPEQPMRFVDCTGDQADIPARFRPSVGEGSRSAMQHGPLAGYPVVGVEVRLTGGAYDMLCSTEEHFRHAGEKATRLALANGGTRLLEPWHDVRVEVPQEVVGELLSDIAAHRGRVVGMEVVSAQAQVHAQCPYRELRTFAGRLEAMTGGRGTFDGRQSHHEPVPEHLVDQAIRDSPFRGSC